MAYYLRVFCTSPEPVRVREISEWAAAEGVSLRIEPTDVHESGTDEALTSARIEYGPGRAPLIVDADSDAEAVAEEIEEFADFVGEQPSSEQAKQVLDHLRKTKMVLAVQLPTAEADDATFAAVGSILRYFAEHRNGLIQADGEGIYDGERLIIPIE